MNKIMKMLLPLVAALWQAMAERRIDFVTLVRCMEEGRMTRIMTPYMEALS
ncbi:MAG: hypothetical protein ILM98_14240 [Kiritimatiellae bacterium]|nr:hypothetical protein [Kiritimatiellia bacterium]